MGSVSYAVIATGGRQVRVEPGALVKVDRLGLAPGEEVTFERVLLVGADDGVRVGDPVVPGAKVAGKVVEEGRDRKVLVFKKKRRKQYRRLNGHRQWYTLVRIESIEA